MMNVTGYDVVTLGNHEFDYGMDQFLHIAKDLAKYPYISANFTGKDGKPYFDAYKIFEVKGVKVAFVGVCTPETFTKSTPTYFQDANGNYIYGFCEGNNGADLYNAVQKAIDAAKAQYTGAYDQVYATYDVTSGAWTVSFSKSAAGAKTDRLVVDAAGKVMAAGK